MLKDGLAKSIIKIILLVIGSATLCMLVILSLRYSFCAGANSNVVSMFSGFWSAGATAILGFIAVWQNRRYKKLSDESTQRMEQITIIPECYLLDITTNKPNDSVKCKIMFPDNEDGRQYYLYLTTLNLPMINITITKINFYDEKSNKLLASYTDNFLTNFSNFTILENHAPFLLNILIPKRFDNKDITCEVTIQYGNIYGNKIIKLISFTRNDIRNNPNGNVSNVVRLKASIKEELMNGQA